MSGELILVVDDEPSIIQLARLYLEREGFRVQTAADGQQALAAARGLNPAAMVLDLMLPVIDGLEVCRTLRAENNPVSILILTARDEDVDKILGLELGADDYLTKPFNPRELVARVKAILRRADRHASQDKTVVSVGDLVIDPARHEVHATGILVDLRAQEFELLLLLAENAGRVLTREQLLNQAWGYDFAGQTRTVDVHIAQLRRKLSSSTVRIETVTSVGYKLAA